MRTIAGWLFKRGPALVAALILIPIVRPHASEIRNRVFDPIFMIATYGIQLLLTGVLASALLPLIYTPSSSTLHTVMEVIPAIIVAIYALVLGSLFIVVQLAFGAYGTRSSLILTSDETAVELTTRPLVLAALAIVSAFCLPDMNAEPSAAITAAIFTLSIGTILNIFNTTIALPGLLMSFTAPVNFAKLVLKNVEEDLTCGWAGLVVFKVPLLGEMIRLSVRRGDTPAIRAGLEAIRQIYGTYLKVVAANDVDLAHSFDDGTDAGNCWMAENIADSLVRAVEESLSQSASEADVDQICLTFQEVALASIAEGRNEDALIFVDGLIRLSTSAHQVTPSGMVNVLTLPGRSLARIAGSATDSGFDDVAVRAVAGWALATAYCIFHLELSLPPLMAQTLDDLGNNPPLEEAMALVQSEGWTTRWANKQYRGPEPVLEILKAVGATDDVLTE